LVLLLVVVGQAQAAVAAIEDDDGDDILDLDDVLAAADTTTTTTDHRVDRIEKVLPLTVVNVADDVFDSIFDNNATTTTTISAAAAAAAIVDAVVDAAITTTTTEKDSTDDDDDKRNDETPPGVVEDEQQTKQDDEATSAVDESSTTTTTTTTTSITIRPELLPMTNDQLTAVCLDRGYDIRKGDGTTLTRDDLLQAATRCLQLADAEMHDMLDDDHPELLAVELESEIQRMKVEKERLESEQVKMLREKASLEEQLREAGIDPGGIWSGTTSSSTSRPPSNSTGNVTLNAVAANGDGGGGADGGDSLETLEDVLRTSFTMLFDRIGRDMNLVGKVLGYVVVKPGGAVLAVLWRYSAPTVEGLVQQVLVVTDQVLATGPMVTVRQQVIGPVVDTLLPVARPVLVQARSAIQMGWKKLDTIESVHKGAVLAGSVLGPLKNSLLVGWRTTLQPNLAIARRKSVAWWQRLRLETKAKQQQQQQQQQQQLLSDA
jgi:hypothetical protein